MQFALLISVIIALLLSAFLLLTHVQSFFKIKSNELLNATELSNQQIFKSLSESISKDTLIVQEHAKTQKVIASYYGAWTKAFSEITIHNRKVSKTAFVGSSNDNTTPNLYLANTNSPLVVVGNTRLEGRSYLPKQGIKAGNISGNYYQGSRLHYGQTIESAETLPKLSSEWISYLESITNGALIDDTHSIRVNKDIKYSFYKPHVIINDPSTIVLGDEKIIGNVIIQSGTKIIVNAPTRLENVLLIAPHIVIANNVKGSMQLIATKKIDIGTGCYFSYPSAALLFDKSRPANNTQGNNQLRKDLNFTIDKNTVIEGSVVYLTKHINKQNRVKTHLKIEPSVEVIGEVYCQGNIDFQGTVRGALYANQFIANQSGSIYLNHIYNGKILTNPIPNYAGLPFNDTKKAIAKWLY